MLFLDNEGNLNAAKKFKQHKKSDVNIWATDWNKDKLW